MSSEFCVLPVVVAGEPDAGVRAAVEGACEVDRRTPDPTSSHDDFVRQAGPWLHRLAHPARSAEFLLVAVAGSPTGLAGLSPDDVVGYASGELPLQHNTHLVESLQVRVLPEARGRGIGTALLDAVIAAAPGRTHLSGWIGVPVADAGEPGALTSRTDPIAGRRTSETDWVRSRGFEVAQVERYSRLDVPAAPEPAAAPPGYALTAWVGPTPDALRAPYAALMDAFERDHPTGDVATEAATWSADELAAMEAANDSIVERATAVAVHEASGELVAATRLRRNRGREASAEQGVTVVRADHRGRGLGLAIKRANLVAAKAAWPGLARVHTWNAGENDHMWAVNEALGFRTAGVEIAWQRAL